MSCLLFDKTEASVVAASFSCYAFQKKPAEDLEEIKKVSKSCQLSPPITIVAFLGKKGQCIILIFSTTRCFLGCGNQDGTQYSKYDHTIGLCRGI